MNLIRRFLYAILGGRLYFRLVSLLFIRLYRWGLLRWFGKFRTHYLVAKLIRSGDTVIDIGANMGYYSSIFLHKAGKSGKVLAVEPVPLYREILQRNCSGHNNLVLYPTALGERSGEITMGIPGGARFRHGLTRVLSDSEKDATGSTYTVPIDTPEALFGNLEQLNYIKCDIEGYEGVVIPGFKKLIEKFNPIIQVELEKRNFEHISGMLADLGYRPFISSGKGLKELIPGNSADADIIFIPGSRLSGLSDLVITDS